MLNTCLIFAKETRWEVALGTSFFALFNGGTAGFIWMHLVAWSGFICINISMAEMASMAPTTGGQYHWVSEFAPYKSQKFLSFIIGRYDPSWLL